MVALWWEEEELSDGGRDRRGRGRRRREWVLGGAKALAPRRRSWWGRWLELPWDPVLQPVPEAALEEDAAVGEAEVRHRAELSPQRQPRRPHHRVRVIRPPCIAKPPSSISDHSLQLPPGFRALWAAGGEGVGEERESSLSEEVVEERLVALDGVDESGDGPFPRRRHPLPVRPEAHSSV